MRRSIMPEFDDIGATATSYCLRWSGKERQKMGDGVFFVGPTSLISLDDRKP